MYIIISEISNERSAGFKAMLQHTATHYNTLKHTATQGNTLLHTATQCSTLQHTAPH